MLCAARFRSARDPSAPSIYGEEREERGKFLPPSRGADGQMGVEGNTKRLGEQIRTAGEIASVTKVEVTMIQQDYEKGETMLP